jgi:sporulation protein YlmC with PRC-barrel domain
MYKFVTIVAATVVGSGVAFAALTEPQFVTLQQSDMLSSNVVGLDIYDTSNNDIGKIQDVAFDSSKTVKGYVVSVGGFLGMGSRYVIVDPGSVNVMYDNANKRWHASMNATKDQLKAAPEFKYEGAWNASKS